VFSPVLPVVAGLSAFFGAGAVLTNMCDAHSMGNDGRALPGAECRHCLHVNRIRPWSR